MRVSRRDHASALLRGADVCGQRGNGLRGNSHGGESGHTAHDALRRPRGVPLLDQPAADQVREAEARLHQAESTATAATSNAGQQVAVQSATVQQKNAKAAEAKAQLDQARLDISYTKIYAPADGVIGQKNVEIGTRVQTGQELMAVVELRDIWVTANYKETQLRRVRPGQPVTVHVDTFDADYDGYVESMPAATGAEFSLLPPENATGNYVKVVQRLPVRIRFRGRVSPDERLRPGMSVETKILIR